MAAVIAVVHTAADGTVVYGTARGDGANEILGPAGFRWYRSLGAWGIVGSRDRPPNMAAITTAAAALRVAGFTVSVDIDRTPRPADVVDADRAARAAGRRSARSAPAGRAATAAQPPGEVPTRAVSGEPSHAGHPSDGRRRTASAQTLLGRAIAAETQAHAAARAAEAAAASEAHRRSPTAVRDRIERLQAQQRRDERLRDGYRRTGTSVAGVKAGQRPPVVGAAREWLVSRIAARQGEIDYWNGVFARQQAAGIAPDFGPAVIRRGDLVRYRGRWYEVVRVNPKSVTVPTSRGTGSVRYHAIAAHRPAPPAGSGVNGCAMVR